MITEGDPDSEVILKSMLISDNLNPSYPMDFQKFLGTITGSGGAGSAGMASGVGAGGPAAGAYY